MSIISIQTDSDIADIIKGFIICKETGNHLFDLILDSTINPMLLSSFAGAVSLFGTENMGKIEEIIIKGLDIQMLIVYKHRLILIAIVSKTLIRSDLRDEVVKALETFYSLYQDQIEKDGCIDVSALESFKIILFNQINEYYLKIKANP